jgi:hypothetical protein
MNDWLRFALVEIIQSPEQEERNLEEFFFQFNGRATRNKLHSVILTVFN